MGSVLERLERLPWTSWEIPLGYQAAAAELERSIRDQPVLALARGFRETDECLAALTPGTLWCSARRAFSQSLEEWPLRGTWAAMADDAGRIVLELTAPGRRTLLRLIDEEQSRELTRLLDEAVNPRPRISYTSYVPPR